LKVWQFDYNQEPGDLLKEIYRLLLIVNACLVCLAHGSNDVANSIAPVIVLLELHGHFGTWPYWLGGVGIALGLLCLGHIVMETVGKRVLKMDFYKGFSCQFATANCIILGTRLGLPLSTTHCSVGAIFGIAIASKLQVCVKAYKHMDSFQISTH
jgi:inorganic phosphate transporter, PiT family